MTNELPFLKEHLINVSFSHITKSQVTRSIAGQRQALTYGGGYWAIDLAMRRTQEQFHRQIAGFLMGLEGRANTFQIELPFYSETQGNYKGDIFIAGASQTGKEIAVDGMTGSTNGILKKGDFIQIGSEKKVYMLERDLDSSGGGSGTLYLHMPIVGTLPVDNAPIVYRGVTWTVALADDIVSYDIDKIMMAGWELSLEEVWN